jgi:hypothetical protein
MEERIGSQLEGRELQWQRKQKTHPKDRHRSTSHLDQFCGLSEIFTPLKENPKDDIIGFSDHIPETLISSQITMDNESQVIIEDCNLLNIEVWNAEGNNEQMDEAKEDSEIEKELDSSEDSFDREKWHRSVLKACTQHASKLDLSIYEPISFGFEDQVVSKLTVELDAMIPIPTQYRTIWYQIHNDIKTFYTTGLLYPIINNALNHSDHWRNCSKLNYRYLPHNIYLKVLTIPMATMKTLFPPDYHGKVTMVTESPNHQCNLIQDAVTIQGKYDLWYWRAIRMARRMDIDPSSPRRAYAKLRGHSRREAQNMNTSEWRAHHFHMWEAIERNKLLREPPSVVKEKVHRC